MKVGYFGIPGSFTHTAASRLFPNAEYRGAPSFREVFDLLTHGETDAIVVPIENTLAGSIYENYDLLDTSHLSIQAETYLSIEHALIGTGSDSSAVTDVYSHQKALEQCGSFFKVHPAITPHIYGDTASSARFVAEQHNPARAAIASREAAAMYGLTILQDHLEDDRSNITRFLAVSHQPVRSESANKTSLILRLAHKQGSLSQVLSLLSRRGCNLMKIESRPIADRPFEYRFYLDFIHDPAQDIRQLLTELATLTLETTFVGTYLNTRPR